MVPFLSVKVPCLSTNPFINSLNILLRFNNPRLRQKYFDYAHERLLSIIKILDILIIMASITVIIYLIYSLITENGYEGLNFEISIISTVIAGTVIFFFIGLSIWLHYFKHIYSDLLLCIINTFSIIFLFEINYGSLTVNQNCSLYFAYSYRFGLMNLMFIVCYKSWGFKVFQVVFGSLFFQIRLPVTDPFSIVYNTALTIFCCFLFYFLEKQDKMAFKKMFESEKQNKSWKKALNTFPEGIAIVKEDKNLMFINQSMKHMLSESDEEKLKQVLFFQIKRKTASTSFSKFSSESNQNHSGKTMNYNLKEKEKEKEKEVPLIEIFDNYVSKKIAYNHSAEKLEKQKSMTIPTKRILNTQISMNLPKSNNMKFEAFLTKLNERFLEIKLAKFTYESSDQAYIIIISDITENFKLKVLEDNKAFKLSLFASFTHEFRTPLNAVFLLSKTLILQNSIPEHIKIEIIDPIIFNADILHTLISTSSDFAAMSMHNFKLQKKNFDFKEFIKENMRVLTCLAKSRNLQTELKLGKTLPEQIFSDENRIKQILYQFYSNALKFTTSGSIKVSVKLSKSTPDRVMIAVKDTGIGMNEKDIGNLTRAINQDIDYINYERVNGSAGASLGLSVSNQIAKRLDKKPSVGISFKSNMGKGSKFFFSIKNCQGSKKVSYLNLLRFAKNPSSKKESSWKGNTIDLQLGEDEPLNDNDEQMQTRFKKIYLFPEAKFLHIESTNSSNKLTNNNIERNKEILNEKECEHEPVLVVDDDEFNIMAVTMLLKMKNIKCLAARNGQLALDLIEEQCKLRENCCKSFQLILMDLNMPVLNGIQASKKLNQSFEEGRLPWMPIVICTAYGADSELTEKFNSGIVEVIHKPLRVDILAKVIETWMKIPEKCV